MAASAMARNTSVPRAVGLTMAVCHGPPTQAPVPVLAGIELRLRKWREGLQTLEEELGEMCKHGLGTQAIIMSEHLPIFMAMSFNTHRALDLWASRGPYITAMLGLQVVCSYPTPTVGVV